MTTAAGSQTALPVRVAIRSIHFYKRVLSPLLPPSCRFTPTCSSYSAQCLDRHGLWQGAQLAVARILRCHPWSAGGTDPVPRRGSKERNNGSQDARRSPARDCGGGDLPICFHHTITTHSNNSARDIDASRHRGDRHR